MKEKFLRNPMASLCGIYALIVLAVFPLVFHDYYFDIVDVKYIFYWVTSLIFIVLSLVTFCVFAVRRLPRMVQESRVQRKGGGLPL